MSVRDLIMSAAGISLYSGFDIRNAVYDSVLNLASTGCAETWPRGVQLNAAGTTIYLTGYNNHPIWSASLSTPFALALSTGWSYSNVISSVRSTELTPDLSKIFSIGTNGTNIQYGTMSTPGLLSSLTPTSSAEPGYLTSTEGIRFSSTGTKLFIAGTVAGNGRIYEFPITAYNVLTIGAPTAYTVIPEVQISQSGDFCFTSDGKCLLVLRDDRVIVQYNLSTPWSISTATYAWGFSLTGVGLAYVTGLCLGNSNTALYVTGLNTGSYYAVVKYTIG